MDPRELRIVPAAALGDPRRLEPLARRIFGEGDRRPGWFPRKLRRERVDPALSPVAIAAGTAVQDPAAWLGYVLVGTPRSRGDAVRTAGTGVRPEARGRGVGRRLLAAVVELSRAAGYRRVELLAERAVVPFYRAQGFTLCHETTTALSFGLATRPAWSDPPAWPPCRAHEHEWVAWLPETWAGTEPASRVGLRWTCPQGPVVASLSREGVAWLVQRLVAPRSAALPRLAAALRQRIPAGAPVLLPLLPATAPDTVALLEAGWSAAQRGALLEHPIPAEPRAAIPPPIPGG